MTTSIETTLQVIREFTELGAARRLRGISADEEDRIGELSAILREAIDGARTPGSRGSSRTSPPPTSATNKPGLGLDGLAKTLQLSPKDKAKVKEISASDLPRSVYTPPERPAFLDDYYAPDVAPLVESGQTIHPTKVVSADGSEVALTPEARMLLGLDPQPVARAPGEPAPVVARNVEAVETDPGRKGTYKGTESGAKTQRRAGLPSTTRRASEPPRDSSPAPQAQGNERQTLLHMIRGGTRRGTTEGFDPASGVVNLGSEQGTTEAIPLEEVLAIFFGVSRGEDGRRAAGQRVVVKLVNDRQVVGHTDDYAEGADALTVVPEKRASNVDYVWIPAWSVKEIQID